MSAGITHFNKVSGVNGVYVGANDAEVQIADSTGALYIGGVAITATAAELNAAAGTGVSSTELDLLDGAIAGTAVASKALALGATKNVDTLVIADGGLYLGAGAGTAVTSTAAELNILDNATVTVAELNTLDVSVQTETIAAAGAVSVTNMLTKLALVGAGAVTLAAPDASMLGKVKVIEMTVDNGDVTLALTNVAGGSAATTCTWSAVGQALILVAGVAKWGVCSESGVALT